MNIKNPSTVEELDAILNSEDDRKVTITHSGKVIDDCAILDAAEAYQNERELWTVRTNKSVSPARYEIIRRSNDSDPCVMASTTGWDTAVSELEEMGMIAAMKAALKVLGI